MEEGHEPIRKKVKISDEMETMDHLSNLPKSVIYHILSLMDAKNAVQTCILSKKWKFLWAYAPCYIFNCLSTTTTGTVTGFEDFVNSVFNNRKSFDLSRPKFRITVTTMPSLVKIVYRYAMSYRSEELDVRKKVQISDQMMVIDRLTSLPNSVIYHILSLMDTKYAVQTCVLSKDWRNHWTNITSLHLNHSSFDRWGCFRDFVLCVLQRRKFIDLVKLKFFCGGTVRVKLVREVFHYAEFHRVEELETDVIISSPPSLLNLQTSLGKCKSLKTLIVYQRRLTSVSGFASLTTLTITASLPANTDLFSNCLNLASLTLAECEVYSGNIIIISAPRLVTLIMSDLIFCERVVINTPKLKFLNLVDDHPYLLSIDKHLVLEALNIHIYPSVVLQTTKWYSSKVRKMVEGCCHANSIKVSLSISEGHFLLYYSAGEEQIKVVELNKDTGEERRSFAFPLVSDFDVINKLANLLEAMLAEKEEQISNQMEMDRISNLKDDTIRHILSFVDTRCAVQTSTLSKRWRNEWTHVHSLDLESRGKTITKFKRFVLDVFHHRKPINLNGLRLHMTGAKSRALERKISSYAVSKGLKELDTNLTRFLPSFYHCQTLTTLKLGPTSNELPVLSALPSLTTLELTEVRVPNCDFFSRCLNLKNLSLIECRAISFSTLNIAAPQLVKLNISNFKFSDGNGRIIITALGLKFFYSNEMDPLGLIIGDCRNLEKVHIHFSQPRLKVGQKADDKKLRYVLDMFKTVEGLSFVKSLRISMNFPKEKFILCRDSVKGETKIMMLDKVTGVQQLVGVANIVEEWLSWLNFQ